ncbi:ATP-binding cassette domain-containing protein [Atopobacter sp. AH10]|uniref:ATP-binding cassette domain-containing protein n=1 Tax=Atopobacter sp. AH10 TaxID=2315861 RepID=UPI0018F5DBD7|nr:ATP-binding cassette domain-containing protein [Atopobacter sp. AH10]
MKQYQAGDLNLYALLFILLLIMEFFVPMRTLSSYFHIAMTGIASAERILDLMKRKTDFSYGEADYQKESDLSVRHLSYSYADGFEALTDLTMQFPYQQLTAIVGPSGSGKSTLAALLAGQYQTKEGQVFCGNLPFQELKKDEIAKNVIRISHDGHLFQDTLKNNLRLAKEEATEEEMIRVLEKVGLLDFFKTREGLETMILSQGKNLSGGQAQRVCLARALLFDAQVYIFDEASSNVDSTSEKIILEQIYRLSQEKTVVYISHRLDTVKEASNIYVLNHGHLIEHGQHDQLMKEKGLYKKLYQEQTAIDRFLTDDLTEEELDDLEDVTSEAELVDLGDSASEAELDDLGDGISENELDDLGAPTTRERKTVANRARKDLRGEKG